LGRLKGKIALVSGGSSGLGRAIALRFGKEGATVVVADRREQPIWASDSPPPGEDLSTADAIRAAGGTANFVKCDVTNVDAVNAVVDHAGSITGRVDIVVNAAAMFNRLPIADTTDDDWEQLIRVNLTGSFYLCRATVRQFLKQDLVDEVRGRLINLSSQHGIVAPPANFGYAVSKAGVAQMTRQLAVDYANEGILVNAVAPGFVVTGSHEGGPEYLANGHEAPAYALGSSRTPYPRLGRPEDIAGAALYLASDDCTFMSGHNMLVDGGWTIW
jgi:NAD(P)-dependent dehydrogenase (short-subunit alcohol dehydrogenase family)